jgi:hypothetical protein
MRPKRVSIALSELNRSTGAGYSMRACIVCTIMYSVTDDLKVCPVDVRGAG